METDKLEYYLCNQLTVVYKIDLLNNTMHWCSNITKYKWKQVDFSKYARPFGPNYEDIKRDRRYKRLSEEEVTIWILAGS